MDNDVRFCRNIIDSMFDFGRSYDYSKFVDEVTYSLIYDFLYEPFYPQSIYYDVDAVDTIMELYDEINEKDFVFPILGVGKRR